MDFQYVTTLGHPSRKHRDWFDENDDEFKSLLKDKHRLHKAHQDGTISVSKKAAYRLKDMQDSMLSMKTEDTQSFADRKDMEKFHDILKTVYGPKSSGGTPLLSADGSTLRMRMYLGKVGRTHPQRDHSPSNCQWQCHRQTATDWV